MMSSGDSQHTWQDTIDAIGQDFSCGEIQIADETISYTDVVRFCEPWEIGNPIYWNESAAKEAGYRGVVVPWSAVKQTFSYTGFWRPGLPTEFPTADIHAATRYPNMAPQGKEIPKPMTAAGIFTNMEIEFFEPVCVGDRITVKGNKLVGVRPRKTSIGEGAFVNRENEFYNQRGELVARAIQGGYSYNP